MTTSIQPGDIVILKTGDGPKMIVETIETRNDRTYANVLWFDTTNNTLRDLIACDLLDVHTESYRLGFINNDGTLHAF